MVNLSVGFAMDDAMWQHCTFDCEIFRCGEVYYSNSIILPTATSLISVHVWSIINLKLIHGLELV
jgi:hypothetical protein